MSSVRNGVELREWCFLGEGLLDLVEIVYSSCPRKQISNTIKAGNDKKVGSVVLARICRFQSYQTDVGGRIRVVRLRPSITVTLTLVVVVPLNVCTMQEFIHKSSLHTVDRESSTKKNSRHGEWRVSINSAYVGNMNHQHHRSTGSCIQVLLYGRV